MKVLCSAIRTLCLNLMPCESSFEKELPVPLLAASNKVTSKSAPEGDGSLCIWFPDISATFSFPHDCVGVGGGAACGDSAWSKAAIVR